MMFYIQMNSVWQESFQLIYCDQSVVQTTEQNVPVKNKILKFKVETPRIHWSQQVLRLKQFQDSTST